MYEDAHVADTDRFARAAVSEYVYDDLAPGATADFSLVTPDLVGVNWDKLHFLVLADYQPAGGTGPYDMLQAAVALPADFRCHTGYIQFPGRRYCASRSVFAGAFRRPGLADLVGNDGCTLARRDAC